MIKKIMITTFVKREMNNKVMDYVFLFYGNIHYINQQKPAKKNLLNVFYLG